MINKRADLTVREGVPLRRSEITYGQGNNFGVMPALVAGIPLRDAVPS
jgi:hypothetical protein